MYVHHAFGDQGGPSVHLLMRWSKRPLHERPSRNTSQGVTHMGPRPILDPNSSVFHVQSSFPFHSKLLGGNIPKVLSPAGILGRLPPPLQSASLNSFKGVTTMGY